MKTNLYVIQDQNNSGKFWAGNGDFPFKEMENVNDEDVHKFTDENKAKNICKELQKRNDELIKNLLCKELRINSKYVVKELKYEYYYSTEYRIPYYPYLIIRPNNVPRIRFTV